MKAIPYLNPVRQWALANGEKYWTIKDQLKAKAKYINFISKYN